MQRLLITSVDQRYTARLLFVQPQCWQYPCWLHVIFLAGPLGPILCVFLSSAYILQRRDSAILEFLQPSICSSSPLKKYCSQRPGIAEVAAFVLFSFSFVLSLHPCSCVQHLFFSRYFGNTMLGDVRKEQTLSQAWFFYRRLLRQFRDCRSSRRFSLTVPVPRVLP